MEEKPFISIVIPTFNRAGYLPRAIESVLKQEFVGWELIIVDDGSTDDSVNIVEGFRDTEARIRWMKRSPTLPKGANTCRNIGIKQAKGQYISFLDSDDEWLPNKLKNEFAFIKKHSPKGIFSGAQINDGKKQWNGSSRPINPGESHVDYIFSDDVLTATSAFTIEREAALSVLFDPGLQRHQDMDFFIRFGEAFGWVFRNEHDTVLHWPAETKRNLHFDSMIQFYEMYESEVSDVNKLARYLQWGWVNAKRYDSSYKDYYLERLGEIQTRVELKYRLFHLMPNLAYQMWRFLKKVKSW